MMKHGGTKTELLLKGMWKTRNRLKKKEESSMHSFLLRARCLLTGFERSTELCVLSLLCCSLITAGGAYGVVVCWLLCCLCFSIGCTGCPPCHHRSVIGQSQVNWLIPWSKKKIIFDRLIFLIMWVREGVIGRMTHHHEKQNTDRFGSVLVGQILHYLTIISYLIG